MNKELSPKVSVVIPVYNVKDYLDQCINSVRCQTLKEIEIILIDDGSTDGSARICDVYTAKDNRIRTIHKCNEGLSCARNIGIEISTAPYIMFVDGDDWVEQGFCEFPYKVAEEHNCDMVLFKHSVIDSGGIHIKNDLKMKTGMLNEAEAMYYNVFIANAAWLALYRRKLFDGIRFPKGRYYEDVGIIHRLIHGSNSIFFLGDALYNHRIGRQGSITTEPDKQKDQDYRDMFACRVKDLLEWGYEAYAKRLAFSILLKYGTKDEYFSNVVRNTHGRILSLHWKRRILLLVFKMSPKLFDSIRGLKKDTV